jgi:hypothetical protein
MLCGKSLYFLVIYLTANYQKSYSCSESEFDVAAILISLEWQEVNEYSDI